MMHFSFLLKTCFNIKVKDCLLEIPEKSVTILFPRFYLSDRADSPWILTVVRRHVGENKLQSKYQNLLASHNQNEKVINLPCVAM